MRFFKGHPEIFDQFRLQVMDLLGLPSNGTDQPWEAGITRLALAPHEYNNEQYSSMIEHGLKMGITEISADEYTALNPEPLGND
jgi:hypothetical protein